MDDIYYNSAQFEAEIRKCLRCKNKPCQKACPAGVSPYDFIGAALENDFKKAGEMILASNPLAQVCGIICPDKFCRKACLRSHLDCALNIPKIQAYIMKKYRDSGFISAKKNENNSKKIAVVGSGPAGIGATAVLLEAGYKVEVFEKSDQLGGALNLIPSARLPKEIISVEWNYLQHSGNLKINFNQKITDFEKLLFEGFCGVIIATGENKFRKLGIIGENLAINYHEYLLEPEKYQTSGNVAIVGGGAVAVDCAVSAKKQGAKNVEMFVRRRISDMRITEAERNSLIKNQIDITTMSRVTKIEKDNKNLTAYTCKTRFNDENMLEDIPNTEIARHDFDLVILALGSYADKPTLENEKTEYAGDCINGSTTAVEAVASGKAAANLLLEKL